MATVLQINGAANWGSTGRIAEEINKVAFNEGWDTWMAYGRRASSSASHLLRIGNRISNLESLIEARLFDNDGLSSRIATRTLVKELGILRPDIIHLHNIHGYQLNYQKLFKFLKDSKTNVVWTLHDCWPFTGHCSHFISCGCKKWEKGCCDCPQQRDYPSSWLFDRSKENYETKKKVFNSINSLYLVPVSKWMGTMVRKSFLAEHPIRVIYNGIDINIFKPCGSSIKKKLNIEGKVMLLGVATAWSNEKGLMDYYALSELLDNLKYQIVLVGLTEKQVQSLPPQIIGVKKVTINELVLYYSAADIVLNLSYAESFGLTTIEGMSCGTPGIVYDRTASPELITNDTGIVVKAGSITDLVKAITDISCKGKSYYSEPCRKRVEESFNSEKQYRKYLDLYNSILQGQ